MWFWNLSFVMLGGDGHTWILHQRLLLNGNGPAYLFNLAQLIKIERPFDEHILRCLLEIITKDAHIWAWFNKDRLQVFWFRVSDYKEHHVGNRCIIQGA